MLPVRYSERGCHQPELGLKTSGSRLQLVRNLGMEEDKEQKEISFL